MIHSSDLQLFSLIIKTGSLSSAAHTLGLTQASISKRLNKLEQTLGMVLLNRTTRRLSLTDEGEIYHVHALRILDELEEMENLLSSKQARPQGLLRVNAPFGFGRAHIAPVIAGFVRRYPEVDVQLQLSEHPLNMHAQGCDIGIHIGEPPDTRLIAQKIADNRRMICAAPAYLRKFTLPRVPGDLLRHRCIVLRQNDEDGASWHFSKGAHTQCVKVRGGLSSNDGEVAMSWALEGLGIMRRSEWDVAKYLRSGRLQVMLEDYMTPSADIYAIYHAKRNSSPKLKAFVAFLQESFCQPDASVW